MECTNPSLTDLDGCGCSSLEDFAFYHVLPQADKVLSDIRFDPGKPTMLYYHGYTENTEKESVKVVMSGKHGG